MSMNSWSRAFQLAFRAHRWASHRLSRPAVPGTPDWLHPSNVHALWLPLPGAGDPVLGVDLCDGIHPGALPRHWHLPGTAEHLPLQVRPTPRARAQRLPTLNRGSTPELEGSATMLARDRLGDRHYLITCGHVAAGSLAAASGDRISVTGGASGTATLRLWQPALDDGALRTPIDAALLTLDPDLFTALKQAGDLLPRGLGGQALANQPLTLRRRGGDTPGRALIFWSGLVDIPGLSPGVADYFLERGIGYHSAVPTLGGDSGSALWDTQERLMGMHLASLENNAPDGANAVFGSIRPVLDWFRVDPVLRGGVELAASAPRQPEITRDVGPVHDAAMLSDLQVVAATLWGEARNQGEAGVRAVACVIANRTRTRFRRRQSAREVCLDRWQFSCWNTGDPNLPRMLRVATRPDRDFEQALAIAREVLSNTLVDVTGGARHYHASRILPSWARGVTPCAVFGDHLFYNNVA